MSAHSLTCLPTRSVSAKIPSRTCVYLAGFLLIVAVLPAQRIQAASSAEVSFLCNADVGLTLIPNSFIRTCFPPQLSFVSCLS